MSRKINSRKSIKTMWNNIYIKYIHPYKKQNIKKNKNVRICEQNKVDMCHNVTHKAKE